MLFPVRKKQVCETRVYSGTQTLAGGARGGASGETPRGPSWRGV